MYQTFFCAGGFRTSLKKTTFPKSSVSGFAFCCISSMVQGLLMAFDAPKLCYPSTVLQ